MNLKKVVTMVLLVTVLTNISYSETGEWSIIPKVKIGDGVAEVYDYNAGENYKIIGVSTDFLYEFQENSELGIGIGYDNNIFEGNVEEVDNNEYDFDTLQFYGIARYNFDSIGIKRYFSGKLGLNYGNTEIHYLYSYEMSTYSVKEYLETDLFFGLAFGMELERINLELGFEASDFKYSYKENDGNTYYSDEEYGSYNVFYLSLGYRF
jgi:hypothetical protein